MRAVACFAAHRPAPFRHRRLRQRRRAVRVDPDARPLPAGARLLHLPRREDALHRPRPAARLRGAVDHGRLSGRDRLDPRLEPAARPAASLVPRHEQRARGRDQRGDAAARLRRGGRVPVGAQALRPRARGRRPAVPAARLVHASARSVRDAARVLGSVRRGGHASRAEVAHGRGRPAQPPHPGHVRDRYERRRRGRDSAGQARLLRGGELRRRQGRRAPARARADGTPRADDRPLRLRPRRIARRARALVQDDVLRGLGARAAPVQRVRLLRATARERERLARRSPPDARRARRRPVRRGRPTGRREPAAAAPGRGACG